jgi:tetratricopeptide (TPR) repeat protein
MPKYREAIAAFERGLELNPTLTQGYHWLGNVHLLVFLYPDPPRGWIEAWKAGVAESFYDKGLEVDPLSIPLHSQKDRYPLVAKSKEQAIWHGHRMVEIAPDSPKGYESLGLKAWSLNGRLDESIRWLTRALERDPQHPFFPMAMGRAYSVLGDPDMALAYFDLAKALTAPDNQPRQNALLAEQAIIRLVAGRLNANQFAELTGPLNEDKSFAYFKSGVFIDFKTGKPADALARAETFTPKCLAAKSIPDEYLTCPIEVVRIYQELGDDIAARNLGDAIVERTKLWSDGWPYDGWRFQYASALAVTGRTDEALNVLENLVSSGWRGDSTHYYYLRFTLYFDVSFDAIRDGPRFQALVATIEADMATQLENVREMQRRGEVATLEELNAQIATYELTSTASSDDTEPTPSK